MTRRPRILIVECMQEISSFNPLQSTYDDFHIERGDEMLFQDGLNGRIFAFRSERGEHRLGFEHAALHDFYRCFTCDGLDAPVSSAWARFFQNQKTADVACVCHMRTAAKFLGYIPHLDDAHDIANGHTPIE